MRWRGFAVMGFLLVTARGGASPMRGQLALTVTLDDPGVAYVSTSTQDLQLELTISRHGSAVLRVRGHFELQSTFLSPPGASQHKLTRSEGTIDDRWEGRARSAHAVTTVKLGLVTGGRGRDPLTLELACKRTMEALADVPGHKRVALQRCTPVTASDAGHPWSDLYPPYARVPLVFAVRGDVLSLAMLDDGQATVEAPMSVRPAPSTSP
jgi:hypothetical protein